MEATPGAPAVIPHEQLIAVARGVRRHATVLRRELVDAATTIATQARRIQALERRLRAIKDCAEAKCHLCLACLAAAWDEDDDAA